MTGAPPPDTSGLSRPFFLVPTVPGPGPYRLDGAEGRHASVVRRMRVGEELVLTDGTGALAVAAVTAVDRASVQLDVSATEQTAPPAVTVTLVQALPKGERSELAVDLATEAGVDALVPWSASRCVARWTADKTVKGVQRWQTVAREAAKQSRRPTVPVVAPLASTAGVATLISGAAGALVLHEAGSVPITEAVLPSSGELVLVVGPEGGVSPEELAAFREAGAQVVRLGREVLRTSTAGAVALGALGVLAHRWADRAASS
ncbi:16S rRNA (uracil1498-N3)-methyltransferase [Nakamurella panacisegetis]|uniref:Ribosomal RNA small subunit methyltransferase E n=1 Tax=Nakamurella panacisegetis TaxID=1090615 RepID=A0A1H0HR67_9ACTN|nr:16S rRNA (uracil(1498)-N(3))-methyltransferase [Nakamurella panacisegetis]SDO21624.1 16S rRNA (uracil1498-N3)-methyltransferase [Nakamurella panacisegetis]